MAKFHINGKGEVLPCVASVRDCDFGDQEDHYTTKIEARKAYESQMAQNVIPDSENKANTPLRELNALAKITNDPEVIEEAIERGSDRTLRNLARNDNFYDAERLVRAYDNATTDETKAALVKNINFPVSKMSGEEYLAKASSAKTIRQISREMSRSNEVNDTHAKTLEGGKAFMLELAILRNKDNQLTTDGVANLAHNSMFHLEAAIESGRYPANNIKELPREFINHGFVSKVKDPKYIKGFTDWAVVNTENKDSDITVSSTFNAIANNPNTGARELDTVSRFQSDDISGRSALLAIYHHPNTDAETRDYVFSKNVPEINRTAKLEKLDKVIPGGVYNEVFVSEKTNKTSFGNIKQTVIQLDKDKVNRLRLDDQEVVTLMGRNNWNGGARYDSETGVFVGEVDTTG